MSSQETDVPNLLQIILWPQKSNVGVMSHFICPMETDMPTQEGRLGFSKDVHLLSQIQTRQVQFLQNCCISGRLGGSVG